MTDLFRRNRIHFCAEVAQQKTGQKGEFQVFLKGEFV
jgi:hypothetical protein